MKSNSNKVNNWLLIEFAIAIIVIVVSFIWAYSPMVFAPNNCYPMTTDGMGHLTKIKYIADALKEFKFYSWFPYWYDGAATIQYYPPLPYFIMAIMYMFNDNAMITFKIYCFISICGGSVGVWLICRKFIGPWCGIFAAVIHTISTFYLALLLYEGVLAQGVVYMLTPWLIYTVISYINIPTKKYFTWNIILTALLILSHAMHAFMVCLCIAGVLAIFIFLKKIPFNYYFMVGISMAFGGILTAFWAVTGATNLENPTIPYVLGEAVDLWTAKPDWFYLTRNPKSNAYFDWILSLIIILSFLLMMGYLAYNKKKHKKISINFVAVFSILLSVLTILFSFGKLIPGFKLIPMSSSLVPGRILSLTGVSAAIICGYIVYWLACWSKNRGKLLLGYVLIAVTIVAIILPIRTIRNRFTYEDLDLTFNKIFEKLDIENSNFNKGRYTWVTPIGSWETYFPMIYNFNMADGYNIEGTPHNRSLWNYNIALSTDANDYVVKNMLTWNVRFAKISARYIGLIESMKKVGFEDVPSDGTAMVGMMRLNKPSSYYLVDKRDCLVLGSGSPSVAMEYPFAVEGRSPDIIKYNLDELKRYKTIYIVEPPLKTVKDVSLFENRVKELVKMGKTIIIEPSNIMNLPVFGVTAYDVPFFSDSHLVKMDGAPSVDFDKIEFNPGGSTRGLTGLDEVYYNLSQKEGKVNNDVIGSKDIGEGKVYFLGMHLSQYLISSTIRNFGLKDIDMENDIPYAEKAKKIITSFIDIPSVYKDFKPESFPITRHQWDNTGGEFTYSSQQEQEIVVSVTYTPRWDINVDGQKIQPYNLENLTLIKIPAGTHTVKLVYSTTGYAKVGRMITLIGLILLIFVYIFYNMIFRLTTHVINESAEKLDIY